MRHQWVAILAALVLAAPPSGALAQEKSQGACAAGSAAVPGELAGWNTQSPLSAARDVSELSRATLRVGNAAAVTLSAGSDVRYLASPEKPGGAEGYGGLFALTVDQAGTYRVALGSAAWVDVLRGTQAVTSVAHSHGPECSGVRKMVDFQLTPGHYTLQIAANGEPTLRLMLVRLP
jgi:hypothetical protein